MNIDKLNNQQKEAVTTIDGPLLVLAGAGSGKTKVLTTRIAYLIDQGVYLENILAITFTNKAAKEMKTRVVGILGPDAFRIQISTFHSFGLTILKENYHHLGYKNNFTIIDSDDSLTIIKKIMKDLNIDPKHYNPKAIKNAISSSKNELVFAEDYEKYVNSDFTKIINQVFLVYEKKLFITNSLDFDDLLILPIKLFNEKSDVLKYYQDKFEYILIDEYQDTNHAQYVLTKMISAKHKNICVVGDTDQSIFSWRGANYRNILNFEKDYPNAKIVLLEENYRSTKTILNAANDVIKNNVERKEKVLWTQNESGLKITYHRTYDEKDEAYYVIDEIKKLLKSGDKKNEIVVLYRTNAQSRNIEEVLLRESIPYKVIGSFYFYKRKEIKDLISYLKLIHNSSDDTSLLRIINVPKRGIGLKTLENLTTRANEKSTCLYDAITGGKELLFKKIIEELKELKDKSSLTELVDAILEKTSLKKELESEKSIEAEIRLENLEEFKSITKSFEEKNGIISLDDFLNEISLVSDIEEYKDNDDLVTLMTIHSAKGLEFDNVFIIGMEEGLFPHANSTFDKNDLEEERRLCYVAITRARKKLWLVNAKRRMLYGLTTVNQPSRFINEINEEYLDQDKIVQPKEKKFDLNLTTDDTIYLNGDKIHHNVFGNGIVIGIEKTILTIAFPHPHGIKKVIKGHKSIKKV